MKKNILLLGGLGFIGSNLIEELLLRASNYNLFVFEFPGVQNPLPDKLNVIYGDFFNSDDLEQIFIKNRIDLVIHLISTTVPISSNDNIVYDIEANLVPTIRLLRLLEKYKIGKIVFVSSGGTVYGITDHERVKEEHSTNPISSYGVIKLAIEKYILLFHHLCGLEYLILRVGNPYGPYQKSNRQGIINIFLRKVLAQEKLIVRGDGSSIRDYLYSKDLARVIFMLIEKNINNEIINIGSGKGISINNILDEIRKVNGDFEVDYVEALKSDVPGIILDNSKLIRFIDHDFTSISDGVFLTYEYLKSKKS